MDSSKTRTLKQTNKQVNIYIAIATYMYAIVFVVTDNTSALFARM